MYKLLFNRWSAKTFTFLECRAASSMKIVHNGSLNGKMCYSSSRNDDEDCDNGKSATKSKSKVLTKQEILEQCMCNNSPKGHVEDCSNDLEKLNNCNDKIREILTKLEIIRRCLANDQSSSPRKNKSQENAEVCCENNEGKEAKEEEEYPESELDPNSLTVEKIWEDFKVKGSEEDGDDPCEKNDPCKPVSPWNCISKDKHQKDETSAKETDPYQEDLWNRGTWRKQKFRRLQVRLFRGTIPNFRSNNHKICGKRFYSKKDDCKDGGGKGGSESKAPKKEEKSPPPVDIQARIRATHGACSGRKPTTEGGGGGSGAGDGCAKPKKVPEDPCKGKDGGVTKVSLIKGRGIGPEITEAVQKIFEAAQVPITWELVDVTPVKVGHSMQIPKETIATLLKNKFALKGPLDVTNVPGQQSVTLTLRKELKLYANIRNCRSFPGYKTPFDCVDLVTIRENSEGEYTGIEHTVIKGVVQSIKLITRKASERIAEYGFQFAKHHNRKKVTCVHKANIMRMSDGLFVSCLERVASKYPDIVFESRYLDTVCLNVIQNPQTYDVLIMPSLYGDILSDLCAGLIGGLTLTPSGNFGDNAAIYEAVHGAREKIAGKDLANPTGLLLSATMMLRHLNLTQFADRIENACFKTIEEGKTIPVDLKGKAKCSEYTQAIIQKLA